MPFCPGHLPEQLKGLASLPRSFFTSSLKAARQTNQHEGELSISLSFSLSLSFFLSLSLSLSLSGRFQQQTDGHLNTKEHIQHCSSTSFRRPFLINYFFLLNELDLETSGWMLNSCSAIYNRFLPPTTYSTRVSFYLKLLLKLPNWKLSISSSTHLFFLLI